MYFSGLYVHYLVLSTFFFDFVRHLYNRVCGFFQRKKPQEEKRKMTWLLACKEYAEKTGKWVVPKKDSDEYKAVKAIQERMTKSAPAEKPVAEKKAPVAKKEPKKAKVVEVPETVVEEKVKKPRAPRKPKAEAPVAADVAAVVLEATKEQVKKEKKVRVVSEPVVTEKAKTKVSSGKKTTQIKNTVKVDENKIVAFN
jgi:hypothetical protein